MPPYHVRNPSRPFLQSCETRSRMKSLGLRLSYRDTLRWFPMVSIIEKFYCVSRCKQAVRSHMEYTTLSRRFTVLKATNSCSLAALHQYIFTCIKSLTVMPLCWLLVSHRRTWISKIYNHFFLYISDIKQMSDRSLEHSNEHNANKLSLLHSILNNCFTMVDNAQLSFYHHVC